MLPLLRQQLKGQREQNWPVDCVLLIQVCDAIWWDVDETKEEYKDRKRREVGETLTGRIRQFLDEEDRLKTGWSKTSVR